MLQQHRVKLETKPKKFEDRVLVRALGLGAGAGIKGSWATEGRETRGQGRQKWGRAEKT